MKIDTRFSIFTFTMDAMGNRGTSKMFYKQTCVPQQVIQYISV